MGPNTKLFRNLIPLIGITFVLLFSGPKTFANSIPCEDQQCESHLKSIKNEFPQGSIIPYISNPVEDESQLPNSLTK